MRQTNSELLTIDKLEVRYTVKRNWRGQPSEYKVAVDGVNLTLAAGETLGLIGESGCGKSSLAQTLVGLVPVSAGAIHFRGADLSILDRRGRREAGTQIQMVMQDPQSALNPRMPVWRIITEPLLIGGETNKTVLYGRACELGAQVGLSNDHLERFPHQFSGGQRQRIAIARALAPRPDLLILDEPTSALDVSIQAQIINLLLGLQEKLGLAYLLIGHDISVIRHMSDRILVMLDGRVVESGQTELVFANPSHAYTRQLLGGLRL